MDKSKIRDTMDNLSRLLDYTAPENACEQLDESVDYDHCERLPGATNTLLYGVPGSGKSWTIQHEYCGDESRMERLVFHPDYTYSDFVGQILPTVSADDKVRYVFTPGPFTRILRKAYTNPQTEYFLIIEEVNRGNAPAIFGEVFQLLDRRNTVGDDGLQIGTSEYAITNAFVAAIVYHNPEHMIRIPSNLSIIGTMNTSDQNVFTLDTAFQRRWIMRMIKNSFDNHPFAEKKILDTQVTWKAFCQAINKEILDNNVRLTSSEDKRLGTYFVTETDLEFDSACDDEKVSEIIRIKAKRKNSRFPEKVLKYLWDDAFKFSRESIFEVSTYKSLEAIIDKFMAETGNERFAFFKEGMFNAITGQDTVEN